MISLKNKSINLLDEDDIGKEYPFNCRVESIRQTSGPTVFHLSDGFGKIRATAFLRAGERALPDVNEGDIIKVSLMIKERGSVLEGEITSCQRLAGADAEAVVTLIKEREEEKTLPPVDSFLISSDCLEKMKPDIIAAAREIRRAIFEERPIMIRHHADCDGYCAAVALERAILPLIKEQHQSEKATYIYYRRSPSKAPYWDYSDVTKDLSSALSDQDRYDLLPPLIILLDLGDTGENILAIKKVKIYDTRVIVIDHHLLENETIKRYVDVFINPYMIGYDYSVVTGMICTELARFVNKDVKKINFIPALAGTGDKSDKQEFEDYLKISGYDREFLKKWALCIDFEASYLKFLEGRDIVDDMFADDKGNHKKLISLIHGEVEKRFDDVRKAVNRYRDVTDLGEFRLIKIDCEKLLTRDEFPNTSKIVRLTHESVEGKKITIGMLPDTMTFRVESVPQFSVNRLAEHLTQKFPYALVKGGGHDFAGAIKFIKAARDEIVSEVESYIRSLPEGKA